MRMVKLIFIFLSFLWSAFAQGEQVPLNDKAENETRVVQQVVEEALLRAVKEAFADSSNKVRLRNLEVRPAFEQEEKEALSPPMARPTAAEGQITPAQGAFFSSYGFFKKWYVGGELLVPIDDAQWSIIWPGIAPRTRWQGNSEIERQLSVSGFVGRNLFLGLRMEGEFIFNNQKGPGFVDLDFLSTDDKEQDLLSTFVTAKTSIEKIKKSQMFLNLYYDFKHLRDSNWTPYVGLGVGQDRLRLKDATNRWLIAAVTDNDDIAPVVARAFGEGAEDSTVKGDASKNSVNYQVMAGVDYRIPAIQRLSLGVKGRRIQQSPSVVDMGLVTVDRRRAYWQVGVNMKVLLGPMD